MIYKYFICLEADQVIFEYLYHVRQDYSSNQPLVPENIWEFQCHYCGILFIFLLQNVSAMKQGLCVLLITDFLE